MKEFPSGLTQEVIVLLLRAGTVTTNIEFWKVKILGRDRKGKPEDVQFVSDKLDCKINYNFKSIDILEMKYAETQNMSLLDKVNIIKTTGVTS